MTKISTEQFNSPGNPGVEGPAWATQRERIVHALESAPEGLTRNELVAVTGMKINAVCGRIGELLETGHVVKAGYRHSDVSNYLNEILVVTGRPTRQLDLGQWGI